MKLKIFIMVFLLLVSKLLAQNPITPNGDVISVGTHGYLMDYHQCD